MNTPKPFDPTKPVRTRDGRAARIICMDAKGAQPVVALVCEVSGIEFANRFNADGKFMTDHQDCSMDLLNIPERIKREVWVNVFRGNTIILVSKDEADRYAQWVGESRLACVRVEIDCEIGEGLDAK